MKGAMLSLSLLLLAAIVPAAQGIAHPSFASAAEDRAATGTSHHATSTQGRDLEGCLIGAKTEYELVDHQGKTHKVTGDKQLLSDEVGHEVDIKGRLISGDTFHETALTHIATECRDYKMP